MANVQQLATDFATFRTDMAAALARAQADLAKLQVVTGLSAADQATVDSLDTNIQAMDATVNAFDATSTAAAVLAAAGGAPAPAPAPNPAIPPTTGTLIPSAGPTPIA